MSTVQYLLTLQDSAGNWPTKASPVRRREVQNHLVQYAVFLSVTSLLLQVLTSAQVVSWRTGGHSTSISIARVLPNTHTPPHCRFCPHMRYQYCPLSRICTRVHTGSPAERPGPVPRRRWVRQHSPVRGECVDWGGCRTRARRCTAPPSELHRAGESGFSSVCEA